MHSRHAEQVLGEETKGEAIITTGVGQHQMWAAQWYPYREPRSWVTSGGGTGQTGGWLQHRGGAEACLWPHQGVRAGEEGACNTEGGWRGQGTVGSFGDGGEGQGAGKFFTKDAFGRGVD